MNFFRFDKSKLYFDMLCEIHVLLIWFKGISFIKNSYMVKLFSALIKANYILTCSVKSTYCRFGEEYHL